MDTLRLDLVFALRTLRRNALFTLSVAATLAIGIGAATAVFGVVNGVLLEPLPIRDQARVVVLRKEQLVGNDALVPFSVSQLRAYAAETRVLEAVAGAQYDGAWPVTMRDGDRALSVTTAVVSGELFGVLGARPVVGRLLTANDDVVGGPRVGVISHAFWRRQFNGDAGVVGRTIRGADSGEPLRIVGVAPPGFAFPGRAEMWVPVLTVMPNAATGEGQWPFNLVGRLRAGATMEQARAELTRYLANKSYAAGEPRDVRGAVRSIESLITGDVRPALLVLGGAVVLLLLIANVNVANLFIVRGISRRRELAIRAAIGAGGWRIVRQIITEGFVLAALGGMAGVLLASWLLRLLIALAPIELPRTDAVAITPTVLAGAALMVIGSALVFGLWPAVGLSRRADLGRVLRSGTRAGATDRPMGHTGSALVVAQVALAVVVLVGAGLLVRTLTKLQGLDMGFADTELSTVELSLPGTVAESRPRLSSFYNRVTERLGSIPGFASATVVLLPPYSGGGGWDAFYTAEGQSSSDVSANPALDFQPVLPTYFATMGIPIRSGRAITSNDREGSAPVVVVSEALARRAWPGQDPLGKRLKFGPVDSPGPWHTIVGVAGDVRYRELTFPRPVVYVAWAQRTEIPPLTVVVVRGRSGQALALADAKRVVNEVEPTALVTGVIGMRQRLTRSLARPRFNAAVVGAFGLVALVLAAVGVYGVIAALVRQRTHEIGVRLALGAQTNDVRWLVLRRGLVLGGVGVLAGIGISASATHLLGAVLYGVSPTDPLTIAIASATLMAVAALGCWIPARAATLVDPLIALKVE
jgi:putative ABC transport system permease protein